MISGKLQHMYTVINMKNYFPKTFLLWGNGELSRVTEYYLNELGLEPIRNVVDLDFVKGGELVFDKDQIHTYWSYNRLPGPPKILLPISYTKMNLIREGKFVRCKEWGIQVLSLISPQALIHNDVKFGNGNWIQEAYIQTGTTFGDNNVVWANSHIGHGCVIGDHNWITSHATLCSSVTITNNCFIGANAVISPSVTLGEFTLVGAGSIITKDTPPHSVYVAGLNNKTNREALGIKL